MQKNNNTMTFLIASILLASVPVLAKTDRNKLRDQLETEIQNYDLSSQKIFDKACCDPNTKKLHFHIQDDYDLIQKKMSSCLNLKHRVLDPQTLEERDFEQMARATNKDLYTVINSKVAPHEKKVQAYSKLKKYMSAQNFKRNQIKERYNNRKTCVGRNYQSLYNTIHPMLDSDGGTAYRELRKCLTGMGDLRYSCFGESKYSELEENPVQPAKPQVEPSKSTVQTFVSSQKKEEEETFDRPDLSERQKRKYIINYKSEKKKSKKDRTNN